MGRVVSQKKWIRGINAGTGVLTEVPGSIVRVSNIVFTQRGSLQTCPGSSIIGTIMTPPEVNPVAMGVYNTSTGSRYPYYPTLSGPSDYVYPDPTGNSFSVNSNAGTGNAAGSYAFALVASNSTGTISSNAQNVIFLLTAGGTFGSITATWVANIGTYYSVYYLPGGPNATQGVLLTGPTLNLNTYSTTPNTTIPPTPLVNIPIINNSFLLDLNIGNLAPPSTVIEFTQAVAVSLPGTKPQPAQISPGDPNFVYASGSNQTYTYSGGSASTSATQTNTGTTTTNSGAISGFPAITISSGQTISITLTVTASVSGSGPAMQGGGAQVTWQYSPDGGSTWIAITSFGSGGNPFSSSSSQTLTPNVSGVTTLSNLQFRVQCQATWSGTGGSSTANGAITSSSVSISISSGFTPYGGTAGLVSVTPQILQFANLAILILGNGYAPQSTNPINLSAATLTALANNFTAAYPVWTATTAWNQGDTITATVSSVAYVFTAQNGGQSGSGTPTWPAGLGATVADGQIIWKNTGIATAVAPRGAAHGVVYAGSLWLANTSPTTTADQIDGPTCLKMSDSNTPTSWNPANTAFIGKDDGQQITGLATYTIAEVGIAPTGALVVFKEFSTYQIIGVFGASDFQITQAQTDLGCIGPRSIQFLTGYGIIRFTHLGFAIFNGVTDTLISEEIRPYIFGGIGLDADITGIDFTYCWRSQSCQMSSPPLYACCVPLKGANGTMTRTFIYDLVLKAWTILDLPWQVSTLMQARTGEGSPLPIAGRADGTGAVERLFAADPNWDSGTLNTLVNWSFTSTHVFRDGSSTRAFYRKVVIRGYSAQPTAQAVTVTVQTNGNPFSQFKTRIQPQPVSLQFELQVDLMLTAQNVQLKLSGSGVITVDALDWSLEPKAGGSIVVG